MPMFYKVRNNIIRFLYGTFLKPFFFQFDPELVHDLIIILGRILGSNLISKKACSFLFSYSNPVLEQTILGIKFKNPVGLAAGFDKNAELTGILPSVGFGFAEVGSITGEKCEGNPKPRLWRLVKSKSLLVWYGLKNDGADILSRKLSKMRFAIPIGINIAKTNSPETIETKKGIRDYIKVLKAFRHIGSYITINISCPNAFGGLPFTDPKKLELLLLEIDKIETEKPIFLKLPPDLSENDVDRVLSIAQKHTVDGFICSNLTKKRDIKHIVDKIPSHYGGMSGMAVKNLSNNLIAHIYKKTRGKYIVVGLGGIFNAEDAYKKIKLGASLVQLITGMIFEGPQLISEINIDLVRLLKKDGFKNVSEAIGVDNK